MPPQVNGLGRNGHEVSGAGRDVAIAARAEVGLGGLVGLDHPHLGVGPEVMLRALGHWSVFVAEEAKDRVEDLESAFNLADGKTLAASGHRQPLEGLA